MRVLEPLGDLVEAFAPGLIIVVFCVAVAMYAVLLGAGVMALSRIGSAVTRVALRLPGRLARRLPFRRRPPHDPGDPEFR